MTFPIETPDGIRLQISDQDGDDFIHDLVSVRVENPDGFGVIWKLPQRLMRRLDVCQAVYEEILAELEERVQNVKRLGLR